jgi:hypothetical protein
MFLGAYHFDGDPAGLLPAYERLFAGLPSEQIQLHVCVLGPGGLIVLDACPSEDVFAAFSTNPEFAAAVASAGLPQPRVERLGVVHRALAPEQIRA